MRMIVVAAFLISASVGAAQQRTQQPSLPPATGTAELSGTIMTDEPNPRPVRRAVVSLSMASIPISRSTTTDDAGKFAFVNLPAGNYAAPRATKPGYVSVTYGEKRVGGIGSPITLVEGQRVAIAFKMMRGAVITGTLLDQGRPAQGYSVQTLAVRVVNGVRVAANTYYYEGAYGTTDDRGIYRIYGLPPGDYVVMVASRSVSTGAALRSITEAEMQWAQQQFQGGYGAGTAQAPGGAAAPPPAQAVAAAPVYYPGTTMAAQATLVTVAAGQERGGVDFGLQNVPTARVGGTIIGLDGQPASTAQVTLVPRVDSSAAQLDSMLMMESMMMGRTVVTEGKFAIQAVKPGEYTIAVRGSAQSSTPAAPGSGRGGPAQVMNLWASADISVNGVDQNDLILRLVPGIEITGRVTFEGDETLKPADLSTIQVRLRAAPTAGVTVSVGGGAAVVGADGTFTLKGITPGRYLVMSFVPGGSVTPTWTMKSARVGDVDAGDIPFEVGAGRDPSEITVTYTDKTAELSGRLLDGANKPTSQLSIILFPTDKVMWSQSSRRIRQPIRPANDGVFKFQGVLAGEYYLAALSDFDMADVYKPEFLEQVAAVAMKITIGDGEKKVQDLKIAGGLR